MVIAGADGRLTETVYLTDPSNPTQNVSTIKNLVWSKQITNVAAGVPVFRFYDESGTVLPVGNPSTVVNDATQVSITLHSTWKDQQFSDTRRMWFRNR